MPIDLIDLGDSYTVSKEIQYIDKIIELLVCYFVTQSNDGFENGLIVGMMLSNSGII